MEKIRNRQDIPQEDKWAIEDLYPTDQAWEQELNTLDEDSTYLASFAGRLGQSGEVLCQYLTAVENMNVKADKLGNYCMRRADEDTRNGDCQAMTGRYISKVVPSVLLAASTPRKSWPCPTRCWTDSMQPARGWSATAGI